MPFAGRFRRAANPVHDGGILGQPALANFAPADEAFAMSVEEFFNPLDQITFQLPFAVIPLVQFTSERAKMGDFVNSRATTVIAWCVAAAILFFNGELLWLILRPA